MIVYMKVHMYECNAFLYLQIHLEHILTERFFPVVFFLSAHKSIGGVFISLYKSSIIR